MGGEICTGFCWVNMKEGEHLDGLGVDGRNILKCILKQNRRARTELMWHNIGTTGRLL